jgi:hypothetical protein
MLIPIHHTDRVAAGQPESLVGDTWATEVVPRLPPALAAGVSEPVSRSRTPLLPYDFWPASRSFDACASALSGEPPFSTAAGASAAASLIPGRFSPSGGSPAVFKPPGAADRLVLPGPLQPSGFGSSQRLSLTSWNFSEAPSVPFFALRGSSGVHFLLFSIPPAIPLAHQNILNNKMLSRTLRTRITSGHPASVIPGFPLLRGSCRKIQAVICR